MTDNGFRAGRGYVPLRTRREAIALLGTSALALMARGVAAADGVAPGNVCIARPEQTEGPFFVDPVPDRSDLRTDPVTGAVMKGTPLRLEFVVASVANGACAPLPDAKVDVWHCDTEGRYSGGQAHAFLRGVQATGGDGVASFLTIYPGAYGGRAVHIHFKIRTAARGGRTSAFTSQIYFDDALTDRIYAAGPYAAGRQRMRNRDDYLYRHGGPQLTVTPALSGDLWVARFAVGLTHT